MKPEVFDKFDLGYISKYDIDKNKIPKNALSDCLNLEINRPLYMLKDADGYDTELSLPSYSGSRTVAFRKWSVDNPSSKELIALVRASENMLYFSEDFEMPVWTFTAGGATLNSNFGTIAIRMSDRITNTNNTTSLVQNVSLETTGPCIFSVYFSKTTANRIRITIIEGGNSTSAESTDSSGTLQRLSVTRSVAILSISVKIDFPDSAGADTFDIWGAQVERSTSLTGYGATWNIQRPYYIYLNPYWNGSAWVDGWDNLTDERAGLASSVVANTSFVIAGIDGADDFYNNWRTGLTSASINGDYAFVHDFAGASDVITTDYTFAVVNGDGVYLTRFPNRSADNVIGRYLSGSVWIQCDENKISFIETNGALRISFGKNFRPLLISYCKVAAGLNGSSADIVIDRFDLTNTSFAPYSISTLIPGTTASVLSENLGITTDGYTDVAGGALAVGTYYLSAVMVIRGQRILAYTGTRVIGTAAHRILEQVKLFDAAFNPGLTSIEYYIGTEDNDQSKIYIAKINIDSNSETWTRLANGWRNYNTSGFYIGTTAIDYNQPSLLQNMGRSSILETRNRFNIQYYLRGRIFTGQTDSAVTNGDEVRFSHIQALTEALDIYPYDKSQGYGYIIAETGTAERIVGYAATRDNDLLIFKDKSTLLYEVQSGGSTKRLVRSYDGIGLSTFRGIAESDYGIFWYDQNGIYLYTGGVNAPKRIAEGKIKRYLQTVLKQYLPYSFAHFNRKLQEYWIFIQVSGAIGNPLSDSPGDYKVFRYSPDFDNWNILRFDFIPIWASESLNGEIILASPTSSIFKYGYTNTLLPNGYVTTHPYSFGTLNPKMAENIKAIYSSAQNLKVSLIVNDESSVRSGNAIQFLSARTEMDRQPKSSTRFRRLALKIEKLGGATFEVSSVEVNITGLTRRYAKSS